MKEVSRREKEAGIIPEPDIDTYMKVSHDLTFYYGDARSIVIYTSTIELQFSFNS